MRYDVPYRCDGGLHQPHVPEDQERYHLVTGTWTIRDGHEEAACRGIEADFGYSYDSTYAIGAQSTVKMAVVRSATMILSVGMFRTISN